MPIYDRPALLLEMVETVVDLDALQPTAKGRSPLEAAKSKISLHQNFLGKILSIVRVAGDVAAVGDDAPLVEQDKLLECPQITFRSFARLLQKLFIWIGGRRARPLIDSAFIGPSVSHISCHS